MYFDNFNVMHALATGVGAREARQALSPFNLFAFIVHGEEEHPTFHQEVVKAFERLDHSTGHELLFFAVLDAPREWQNAFSQKREYFRMLQNGVTAEFLQKQGPKQGPRLETKGVGAQALAAALGIPREALPCLVVTGGFGSKDSFWVRTCEQHVEKQLNTLGLWASKHEHSSFQYARSEVAAIDLCGGVGDCDLMEDLAGALADVLAADRTGRRDLPSGHESKRAQASLRRLHERISSLKMAESRSPEIERLQVLLASVLALAVLAAP